MFFLKKTVEPSVRVHDVEFPKGGFFKTAKARPPHSVREAPKATQAGQQKPAAGRQCETSPEPYDNKTDDIKASYRLFCTILGQRFFCQK